MTCHNVMHRPRRGSRRAGILFVLSAPSGAGKTTICRRILRADRALRFSVSCTSRPRRPNERTGSARGGDYRFISRDDFKQRVLRKEFVEWALVHGNYYGTPRAHIDKTLAKGRDLLLDIDVQGGMNLRKHYPDNTALIFILPPSYAGLRKRLRERGTEDAAVRSRRIENARAEIMKLPRYDYVVVNDKLSEAVDQVKNIITAERLKIKRHDFSGWCRPRSPGLSRYF